MNEKTSHSFIDSYIDPAVSLLGPPPCGESGAQPSIKTDLGKVSVRDQKGKTNIPLRTREDKRSLSSKLTRIQLRKTKRRRRRQEYRAICQSARQIRSSSYGAADLTQIFTKSEKQKLPPVNFTSNKQTNFEHSFKEF